MRTQLSSIVGLLVACFVIPCVAQDPPQRIRIGGAIQQSQLISHVAPAYPELAKQARIQGTVRLEAVISAEGKVLQLQVVSGHPLLQQAALQAVSQWEYRPTLLNGKPVEVVSTVDVVFKLDGSAGAEPLPADRSAALLRPVVPVPDPAAEIARLRGEITANPGNALLHRQLAMNYMRARDVDAAIAALREGSRVNPEDGQLRLTLGQYLLNERYDYAGAVAEIREALLRKSDDTFACAWLARAHEFVYDYGQAVQQYAECIRLRPGEINDYRQLAAALYRREKLERATTEFRRYAALHPNPAEAHFRVAEFLQTQNLPAAMAQARETLRVQSDHAQVRELLGRMESSLADQQQRILGLREYVARNPGDPMGYVALSFLLHLNLADHEGALEAMRKSAAASADADLSRLGEEAVEARGFDGAITELRKLAGANPQSPSVYRALAELLLRKGLSGEALEVARQAVLLAPENREARVLWARALSLTGDAERSRQEMQTSVTLAAAPVRPRVSPELESIMRRGPGATGAADAAITANETTAVGSLRTLNTVLVMYSMKYQKGFAASLAALGPGTPPSAQAADLIDASLASGARSGYVFVYSAGPPGPQGEIQSYTISASPSEPGKSGRRFFFTDQSGVIRYDNGPANASSPPVS